MEIRVKWTESIFIDRPKATVYRAVLDQNTLMKWSAWPAATGYTCRVEGDGITPGSQIVFTDEDGKEQGRQTLTSADGTTVRNVMRNRGPGGRDIEPKVDFRVEAVDAETTRVSLDFDVDPPVPAPLRPVAKLWLTRRIRPLHVKDLQQLKDLVERRGDV